MPRILGSSTPIEYQHTSIIAALRASLSRLEQRLTRLEGTRLYVSEPSTPIPDVNASRSPSYIAVNTASGLVTALPKK